MITKNILRGETPLGFITGSTYGMSAQIKLDTENPSMSGLQRIYIAPQGIPFEDLEEVTLIDSNSPLGTVITIESKWTSTVTANLKVEIRAELDDSTVNISGIGDNVKVETPSVLKFPYANDLRVFETNSSELNLKDTDNIAFKKWGNGFVCQPNYYNLKEIGKPIKVQFKVDFNGTHLAELVNLKTGSVASSANAIFISTRGGVSRYEVEIPTNVPAGLYYVRFTGSQEEAIFYNAESEPIDLRVSHDRSIEILYKSDKLAHDIDYTSGIEHSIIVKGKFDKIVDTNEQEPFTDSAGFMSKINDITTQKRELEVMQLPSYLIRKINIALASDYCTINGVSVKGADKLPYNFNKYYYSDIATVPVPLTDSQRRNLHA